MHTIPPWQTQNTVQPNLALLQPQRNEEPGLSLSHWHLINLRMSSGACSTPGGTVTGDSVWVASLRNHPYDSGSKTGSLQMSTLGIFCK